MSPDRVAMRPRLGRPARLRWRGTVLLGLLLADRRHLVYLARNQTSPAEIQMLILPAPGRLGLHVLIEFDVTRR
jgi:hypothetical protein